MAFKLSKADLAEWYDAISMYEERLESAITEIDHVNVQRKLLDDIRQRHVDEWKEDYDDRSDNWKEGDRGAAVYEFISAWEDIDLDSDVNLEVEQTPEQLRDLPTEFEG